MIIVMQHGVETDLIEEVKSRLVQEGFDIHESRGIARTIIGAIGDPTRVPLLALEAMPGVEKVVPILKPYKLVSREFKEEPTVVNVGNAAIGGDEIHVIAGPCAVESRQQILETAQVVKESGATLLRGGAYKPRTSPYSFQGLGLRGLEYLAEAREMTGLAVVTEVMDTESLPQVREYADILQVGARNMQNFNLLKKIGEQDRPVLLKRGHSSTIEEWLLAAEYIMSMGNYKVILCERGIRTFEEYTRNTLDLSAVPAVKSLSHLPVIVDPSHGTGRRELVAPMSRAAVAAGADGLLVEVHPYPDAALSDGPQSLKPQSLSDLIHELDSMAPIMNRSLGTLVG
ncbi:MAG: 3-deoxy-7-phosphoheptulonate synthase [Clostridia bacterium]|nr:3-deoxy-7-phosphoheptulonate synthase [Clostridia bacterium]